MTLDECRSLKPGVKLLIGDHFVEEECKEVEDYLGTVQVIERMDLRGTGWIYFENLPQPFACSEIVCVYNDTVIDDEAIPYESGDMCLIFGEVIS